MTKLAHACAVHDVKQKSFLKSLFKTYHVTRGREAQAVRCLLATKTEDFFDAAAPPDTLYTFNGAVLVQELLSFQPSVARPILDGLIAFTGWGGFLSGSCSMPI